MRTFTNGCLNYDIPYVKFLLFSKFLLMLSIMDEVSSESA
jgi:hypothetical protein